MNSSLKLGFKHLKLANHQLEAGDYSSALKNAQKAAIIFDDFQYWIELIDAMLVITQTQLKLSDTSEILSSIQAHLPTLLKELGVNHSSIAQVYKMLGMIYKSKREFELSLEYLQKSLAITLEQKGEVHKDTVACYEQLGDLFKEKAWDRKAIDYYQKGLDILKKLPLQEDLIFVDYYKGLAYVYMRMENFDKVILYNEKAIDILLPALGEKAPALSGIYGLLGICYGRQGDGDRQIFYQNKALMIDMYYQDQINISIAYNNLGTGYLKKKDFDQSLYYLLKSKKMREIIQFDTEKKRVLSLAEINFNISSVYLSTGDLELASDYLLQALKLAGTILEKNHLLYAWIYLNLGEVSLKRENGVGALEYFQKSSDIWAFHFGKKHIEYARLLVWKSRCYMSLNQPSLALTNYQNVLAILFDECEADNVYYTPLPKNYQISSLLIDALFDKTKVLLKCYNNTKVLADIKCALATFECLNQVLIQMRQTFRTEGGKLLIFANFPSIYEIGINIISFANEIENNKISDKAFDFCEKAKANLLFLSLQDDVAKLSANVPSKLILQEKELKSQLTYLDKKIQKLTQKEKNFELDSIEQSFLLSSQNDFFDLHQEYISFIEKLETDYPNYYQLKYDTKTVTPTELQSTLEENQILLSYFIGEKSIYIFTITSNEFEVEELEKPDDFEEMIQNFLKSIHAHDKTNYLQLAYDLYELLIAPVELYWYDGMSDFLEEEGSKSSPQQLIIIPHAELSYLPFEALISEQEDENTPYQELNYLVQQYGISYHYSATLWQYAQQKTDERMNTEYSFVGFAPVYEAVNSNHETQEILTTVVAHGVRAWATRSEALQSDGTWIPLPHSKEEAEKIAFLFQERGLSSVIYLQEKATKEQFQEAVGKARYLLVAAHGVVNDEKTALSGLVFYPNTVDGGRETMDGKGVENSLSFEEHGDIWGDDKRQISASFSSITESKNDCILSMEETYPLNIKADLVVLSSCESGIGKLHKGEGMMAVNRGFLVAGAKNVISTLFKVYDKPSSWLTQYLFESILEGENYQMALRAAKLKLIELEEVSPKSWCGFVLIGGGNSSDEGLV